MASTIHVSGGSGLRWRSRPGPFAIPLIVATCQSSSLCVCVAASSGQNVFPTASFTTPSAVKPWKGRPAATADALGSFNGSRTGYLQRRSSRPKAVRGSTLKGTAAGGDGSGANPADRDSGTNVLHADSSNDTSKTKSGDSAAAGGAEAAAFESAATASASAAVAMSAATAAVVGAVAAVTPAPPPRATIPQLLQRVVGLLRAHFTAVLMLYAAKDAAAFLVHRVTQRLTNHVAEALLGTPTSTAGNPWWLYLDQAFIRANPGYEVLVGVFFVACLPLTIALNSIAFTAAALICTPLDVRQELAARGAAASGTTLSALQSSSSSTSSRGRGGSTMPAVGSTLPAPDEDPAASALADLGIRALPTTPPPMAPPRPPSEGSSSTATAAATAAAAVLGSRADDTGSATAGSDAAEGGQAETGGPLDALRGAFHSIAAVLPDTARALRRVWWVDLQFNLRALPLQGLSLLVVPALWTIPRLMRIQLALPAAVLEQRAGMDALSRSSGLMSQSLAAYGGPFAALLGMGRLLEYVQGIALALIPPRWWREVVEVPLMIAGLFLLVKAAVHRLQDLLPLATYLELAEQEAQAARELVQLHPGSETATEQAVGPDAHTDTHVDEPKGGKPAGPPGKPGTPVGV